MESPECPPGLGSEIADTCTHLRTGEHVQTLYLIILHISEAIRVLAWVRFAGVSPAACPSTNRRQVISLIQCPDDGLILTAWVNPIVSLFPVYCLL